MTDASVVISVILGFVSAALLLKAAYHWGRRSAYMEMTKAVEQSTATLKQQADDIKYLRGEIHRLRMRSALERES